MNAFFQRGNCDWLVYHRIRVLVSAVSDKLVFVARLMAAFFNDSTSRSISSRSCWNDRVITTEHVIVYAACCSNSVDVKHVRFEIVVVWKEKLKNLFKFFNKNKSILLQTHMISCYFLAWIYPSSHRPVSLQRWVLCCSTRAAHHSSKSQRLLPQSTVAAELSFHACWTRRLAR